MLGVMFGTFVLVASIATGRGVQEAIVREFSRHSDLRTIDVFAGTSERKDAPEEEVRVLGTMSDAKRERIRNELISRWWNLHAPGPGVPITPAKLAEVAG